MENVGDNVKNKLYLQYIRLECKRILHALPGVVLGLIFLIAMVSGTLFLCGYGIAHQEKEPVTVGVVAGEGEPFVDWMIETVHEMENVQSSFRFRRVSSEEGDALLSRGEITVAFIIPKDYVRSIINGSNKHITIRFARGQETIVSFLLRELSAAASSFILNSEAGLYSLKDYYDKYNLPDKNKDELELNLQYIQEIARLQRGVELEEIETVNGGSALENYSLSALVLLFFLMGIPWGKVLTSGNRAFKNQLYLADIGAGRQAAAGLAALFMGSFILYIAAAIVLFLGMVCLAGSIQGFQAVRVGDGLFCLLGFLPILLMALAFVQLIYEITRDTLSGVLLLFFTVLAMGLCCGCFYPFSYLPLALQRVGRLLPIYQAKEYGISVLRREINSGALVFTLGYAGIFYALCVLKSRMQRTHLSWQISAERSIKEKKKSQKKLKNAQCCLRKSRLKEIRVIALLLSKRLFKRPLFLVVLFLMPVSVLFLSGIQSRDDAVVRIALYSPAYSTGEGGVSSASLTNELLELSNATMKFYTCETEDALREDVQSGRASCGYLLPEDMQQGVEEYARNHTAFIHAVRGKDELATRLVDEILLSRLYRPLAFQLLTDYLTGKTKQPINTRLLTESFESHSSNELLFSFEYADGSNHSLLNDENANYMMLPIRGIVSVLVLLACMSGGLLWYGDRENKLLALLSRSKSIYCGWFALFLPCLYAGAIGVITIKITGSAESLMKEFAVMFVYVFACTGMVRFLCHICIRREAFLAAIPVFMIASLLLCPVFMNAETFLPPLGWIGRLLPGYHYLYALHNGRELVVLALFGVIYIVTGQFFMIIKSL